MTEQEYNFLIELNVEDTDLIKGLMAEWAEAEDPFDIAIGEEVSRTLIQEIQQAKSELPKYCALTLDTFEPTGVFKQLPILLQKKLNLLSLFKDNGEQFENVMQPNVTEILSRYGESVCAKTNSIYSSRRMNNLATYGIEGNELYFDITNCTYIAEQILLNIWFRIEGEVMNDVTASIGEYIT